LRAKTLISRWSCGQETILTMKSGNKLKQHRPHQLITLLNMWKNTSWTLQFILCSVLEIFKNFSVSYFCKGNHEGFFSDQYDTTGNGDVWLITELGNMWEDWFNEESLSEFRKNSYYSTVNSKYNLKIISLDTQNCDTLNFDLIKDSNVDPLGQVFAWILKFWFLIF